MPEAGERHHDVAVPYLVLEAIRATPTPILQQLVQ